MSIVLEASSTTDRHLVISLFDHPGADVVLRSQDSHHIQVPKTYVVNSSPVLGELIQNASDAPRNANAGVSLPVVQLPETGEILHCLLTFIFPVTPRIPPTHEEIMELLSVAQRYKMGTALAHIRASVAQQNPLPTRLEPALRIYALAQKYGLRQEALQTARTISKYPMTIEDFDNKLDIMPGASLYELWKYHERVRAILASDLAHFRESCSRGRITDLPYTELSPSKILCWLDRHMESIAIAPHLNFAELYITMAHHFNDMTKKSSCKWASISDKTMRRVWETLVSVVDGSFEKAESALFLVREREDSQVQIGSAKPQPEIFDVSDTNLILRSSDLVDFRVHKSVLAMASPVLKDLFSLSKLFDGETIDGFPVIQLSEDSELLNCLVSMLYHLPVIPSSHDRVLHLLAACQEYEMDSIQSLIRTKVKSEEFPAPKGAEAYSAYVIASSKGLIPEMENAARQTLNHPMTFEFLGERLRLFEDGALQDLANFRKRYRDNLVSCFESFLKNEDSQFNIWTPCASYAYISGTRNLHGRILGLGLCSPPESPLSNTNAPLPYWLAELYRKHLDGSQNAFSKPLFNSRSIRGEYLSALQAHIDSDDCTSCTRVHAEKGEAFCKELEDRLTQALDEALPGSEGAGESKALPDQHEDNARPCTQEEDEEDEEEDSEYEADSEF